MSCLRPLRIHYNNNTRWAIQIVTATSCGCCTDNKLFKTHCLRLATTLTRSLASLLLFLTTTILSSACGFFPLLLRPKLGLQPRISSSRCIDTSVRWNINYPTQPAVSTLQLLTHFPKSLLHKKSIGFFKASRWNPGGYSVVSNMFKGLLLSPALQT